MADETRGTGKGLLPGYPELWPPGPGAILTLKSNGGFWFFRAPRRGKLIRIGYTMD